MEEATNIREIQIEYLESAFRKPSLQRLFPFLDTLCMDGINLILGKLCREEKSFKMAFRTRLLGIFRSLNTHKTGAICLGVGASAIGMGTAFGFSFAMARERPQSLNVSKFMAEPLTELDKLENSMGDMKSRVEIMILGVQGDICRKLAAIEGRGFRVDRWMRKEGGGGISCVMQDGKLSYWGGGGSFYVTCTPLPLQGRELFL